MSLFPLFANLQARPVLVVGGGTVAARKVDALLEVGAEVRVGAPHLAPALLNLARQGRIRHLPGAFRAGWLEDVWLVIAASNDTAANAAVARAAEARRLLVNVVDDASQSTFHVPARLRRGALTLAISSGGVAPALARRLRADLEANLDESLGALADLVARHRPRIRRVLPDPAARAAFYDGLVDGSVAVALRQGRAQQAEARLLARLERPAEPRQGHVTLVGAGPGATGLLTLAGLRALQRADVIVHDRLVPRPIIDLGRRDAARIDVGKRVGEDHEATQARIHRLLLQHARHGRRVVRLKGGDPLIFGRGGEELAFLAAHGVDYEVVPGITAAIACAAHAGVPLTQRGLASSLCITTTHRKNALSSADWRSLATRQQTLAIYMAVSQLDELPRELMRHGRAADTPFALIENGSLPSQRVITGRLGQLTEIARRHDVRAPALLIVGEVAALARELAWSGRCIDGGRLATAA